MNINVRPNLAAGSSTRGEELEYLSGFGNGFETEALPGALPIGRNSPAEVPLRPLRRAALAARPSRRRAPPTSAPGSTASARP